MLRLLNLGEWSMWVDEGMTWVRASTGVLTDQGPLYATAPLNFVVTRWIIQATEPSLFWLRLFPAACGVLGVAAVIATGERMGSRVAAVIAGLVLALFAWHIDWSQNARHFSVVFLFAAIAVCTYHEFWESGRLRWLVATWFACAIGLSAHSSMSFVIASLGLYAALLVVLPEQRRQIVDRRKIVAVVIFFGLLAAGYLPIVLAVSKYLAANKTAWNPPTNIGASILYYMGAFELAAAALVGLAGAVSGQRRYLLLLCWLAGPPILVTAASSMTIASGSYALPSVGALCLLLGFAVSELLEHAGRRGRLAGGILLVAILADVGLRTALYFTIQAGNRPPWREAIEFVSARAGETDEIYATEGIVVSYYLRDFHKGLWISGWRRPSRPVDQWLLVLEGRASLSDPELATALSDACELRTVFYRNTGPKRRDIEIYRCAWK